jgi:hypothetical protein
MRGVWCVSWRLHLRPEIPEYKMLAKNVVLCIRVRVYNDQVPKPQRSGETPSQRPIGSLGACLTR